MSFVPAELIQISRRGTDELGFLNIFEDNSICGFNIKRAYWSESVPDGAVRGNHAHKACVQILICLRGRIEVSTEVPTGMTASFILDRPDQGLVLWPHVWHQMKYTESAIQLVLASMNYSENDYLRNKSSYLEYYKK